MAYAALATPDVGLPANIDEFISQAREYYTSDLNADLTDREEAQDDNRFANSSDLTKSQWAKEPKDARVNQNRPVLQWNRIPTFVAQVVNDGRQNKPSIKISQGDNGTRFTADFFQDRIRHLEYECNADIAYDTAREQQVTSGRAAIRLSTEWVPGKFKQRPCIEPIEDQFSVVWDAAAKLYDRSDAERCFVVCLISKSKYIRDYGQEAFDKRLDFERGQDTGWVGLGESKDLFQIAEYYCKEYRKRTLCEMPDGSEKWKDELAGPMQVSRERIEDFCTVIQYVIDGCQILGKPKKWIDDQIPIVPLWGRTATVEGQRRTFSLIRNAKDPQRTVNICVSNIMELIGQMPKTPWMVPIGAIPNNLEGYWQQMSNNPLGYVLWQAWDQDGRALPEPKRMMAEPPIQALALFLRDSIDGIKAAMGIYDASLGNKSNETSGIAIERRKKSAEVVNYHFADNESRTRKTIGQRLIKIISKLDKPGTTVPVRSEDGKTILVPIGEPFQHPKTGETITHDLTAGDYGVVVGSGPSYESQRQEAYERDAAIIQAWPEGMEVIGDQLFANDDTAGAQERAERLKRWIMMKSPGLIQEPGDSQIPPEVQQKFQALQVELGHAKAYAQKLFEEQKAEQPKLDLEKYKVDEVEKTKRMLGLAALDSQEARMELEQSLGIVHKKVDQAHDVRMELLKQGHEQDMQSQQQDHASGESEADRQAAAEQAEQAQETE